MEEIARVYADALFGAAQDTDQLDEIHEQLGQFADAMNESADMRVFFFSPYFSSEEKREAISAAISGAERGARELPRAARREAPDAGDLPRSGVASTSSGRRRSSGSRSP